MINKQGHALRSTVSRISCHSEERSNEESLSPIPINDLVRSLRFFHSFLRRETLP